MEDMLLPFRKGLNKKHEKKERVKERIGSNLAAKHKAQSRIRESDIEFEKAFAEAMGGKKEKSEEEKPVKKISLLPKAMEILSKPKKETGKPAEEIEIPAVQEKKEKGVMIIGRRPKPANRPEVRIIGKKSKAKKPGTKKEPKKKPKKEEKKEPNPAKPKSGSKKWGAFGFWFSTIKASSFEEFKSAIRVLGLNSIEHHARHKDLSKYIGEFYDKETAVRIKKAEKELKGEPLRKKILEILE